MCSNLGQFLSNLNNEVTQFEAKTKVSSSQENIPLDEGKTADLCMCRSSCKSATREEILELAAAIRSDINGLLHVIQLMRAETQTRNNGGYGGI